MSVKKSLVRATLGVATLGLGAWVFGSILFPTVATNAKTASAEVGANVKEFIKLAVDTSNLALSDGSSTVIVPSAAGTLITGDVNVAVSTNTAKGYSLSAYTADSSTAMANSNPSVSTGIGSIANVSGYDTTTGMSDLSANTWGFQKYVSGAYSNWFGVGSSSSNGTVIASPDSDDGDFCENLSYPLNNTGCDADSYNTYAIKFGAKLTNTLPSGTYTNNVIFSAVAKSEGTKYTLNFDADSAEATGNTNPRTILEGSTVTLPEKGFTREGYYIDGWALTGGATTATYTTGQTITVDDLISAATAAGQTPATNNQITLYAVWGEVVYMQDFDPTNNLLNVGDQATLTDSRDGKTYTVKRLPDGKVWMTQNLALGMDATTTGLTLTSADTNIDNNTTYYLPPAGKQGSSTIDDSSTLTATAAADFGNSDNRAKTQFRTKDDSVTNDSDTGYYNFYTATLGFSYLTDGKTSGSSTRDICPKGWRLPKTTDSGTTVSTTGTANDFTNLARAYSTSDWSGTATNRGYYTTSSAAHTGIHTGLAAAGNNYAGFSYAGVYEGTSQYDVGSLGYYWSSSVYDTYSGYLLYFDSSYVAPQNSDNKDFGRAVRCVAK